VAISVEVRQRAVDCYLSGEGTYEAVAARFSVGTASVKRWVKQHQETGSLQPKSGPRGRKPVLHGENLEKLKSLVKEDESRDQLQLVVLLWSRFRIKSSTSAVSRALIRNQINRKKTSIRTYPLALGGTK
jgi:transposase